MRARGGLALVLPEVECQSALPLLPRPLSACPGQCLPHGRLESGVCDRASLMLCAAKHDVIARLDLGGQPCVCVGYAGALDDTASISYATRTEEVGFSHEAWIPLYRQSGDGVETPGR